MEQELARPPSLPWVSALQAPRDAEQRDLGGPTLICNTVMNNACNDVNVVVAMDPDTVL